MGEWVGEMVWSEMCGKRGVRAQECVCDNKLKI